jgi:hypothetical protein
MKIIVSDRDAVVADTYRHPKQDAALFKAGKGIPRMMFMEV